MSNSLDPHQAHCFVGPDLGPNCLQRLSADEKSLLAEEELMKQIYLLFLFLSFFFFFFFIFWRFLFLFISIYLSFFFFVTKLYGQLYIDF